MSIRRLAMISGPLAGLALGLAAPTLAAAQDMPPAPAPYPAPPAYPGAPMHHGGPDMRPVWQGSEVASGMPDSRAREDWLNECQRRLSQPMEMHYRHDGRRERMHGGEMRRDERAYRTCATYFDDYYAYHRAYQQRYAYTAPVAAQPAPECHEVVTTEYVPIRTRVIPRRVVPTKRVRDKRIRIY